MRADLIIGARQGDAFLAREVPYSILIESHQRRQMSLSPAHHHDLSDQRIRFYTEGGELNPALTLDMANCARIGMVVFRRTMFSMLLTRVLHTSRGCSIISIRTPGLLSAWESLGVSCRSDRSGRQWNGVA